VELRVLCLNGGSSSLKFGVFDAASEEPREIARGEVERVGSPEADLKVRFSEEIPAWGERGPVPDLASAVALVWKTLARAGVTFEAAGHRIVHGGPRLLQPVRIDAAIVASLRSAVAFAPLHLPGEIAAIEAVWGHAPSMPQVACFDTGFHARMPAVASRIPLPSHFSQAGVRRYGFHGLSYESILTSLGPGAAGRLIVAHLGNGASLAALRDGEPLDTTMGLTPSGGLVMGTRPGDLDPGVLLFLERVFGLDSAALGEIIDRRSGLLALSETTADMRTLLAARELDERAALAVSVFCYSARKWIGAFAAALGGLDLLVFTGGIGERAAPVREQICRELAHLGIELDPARNARSERTISAEGSRCAVRVIPTDEERVLARHTSRIVSSAGA
jgi:acetate kinase